MDNLILEGTIIRLKKKIKKLQENYIPNQDFTGLKNKLLYIIQRGIFQCYQLDEGCYRLSFPKIYEMLENIKDKGNFYILFVGSQCNKDIGDMYISTSNEFDVDELLDKYQIKRIYDNRVHHECSYLIAMDKINQENIPHKNICMFIRK